LAIKDNRNHDRFVAIYLNINKKKIGFIRFILEGYDGLAIVTTIDVKKGHIKLITPLSRYQECVELINSLSPLLVAIQS